MAQNVTKRTKKADFCPQKEASAQHIGSFTVHTTSPDVQSAHTPVETNEIIFAI